MRGQKEQETPFFKGVPYLKAEQKEHENRGGKGMSQREGEGVQTSFEGLPPKAKKSEEREGRPRKGEIK